MHPRTVWQALPSPRYPLSFWPWRSANHLISGALAGITPVSRPTHDAGYKLTEADFDLAARIDAIAAAHQSTPLD
ncbi:hypothetical protein GCM10015535_59980 [Streptomyces gelaticus]|uniref:Uncharacterized protein n=1 Tax=Streptomyces gelaticus TaxID=285446 RepID=A0ABQ2WA86_9ACTN|nr:hypothetical protein GCM10015535_59980 [Streptomyces gelaticus]